MPELHCIPHRPGLESRQGGGLRKKDQYRIIGDSAAWPTASENEEPLFLEFPRGSHLMLRWVVATLGLIDATTLWLLQCGKV
jgi:hypothetical protein